MRPCVPLALFFVGCAAFVLMSLAFEGAAAPPEPQPAPPAPAPAPAAAPVAPPAAVPPVPAVPVVPAVPPTRTASSSEHVWVVTGYGATEADAREEAYAEALRTVNEYLHQKFPDLGWQPDVDYLKRIAAVRQAAVRQGPHAGQADAYEVDARVDMDDPILHKMQGEVDEARRKAMEPTVTWRHALFGRILAVFVALFLVIVGYIRLEELTRGYYTVLLRLGAGAVVLLAVLGVFMAF
jgi:hypothetical protein